ncbi:hypothetical protein EV385_6739 [Krasilnikovia cinnamomea]|uniref:Uncharacterized protein n=1 Tax=Krasilnikovia cinnamomea TaxID=349313 RepID=A0A4Q7Z815_9ACTN|nr:hypothetical protein EV385_6739 [Krasilnikovia cinnamomea]
MYRDGYLAVPDDNKSTKLNHVDGRMSGADGKTVGGVNRCPSMGMNRTPVSAAGLSDNRVLCVSMARDYKALVQVERLIPGGPITLLVVVSSGWPCPIETSERPACQTSSAPPR